MYCPSPKIKQRQLLLLCGRLHTLLQRPHHQGQDRCVVVRRRRHRRSCLPKMARGDHHQMYCPGEWVDLENQQKRTTAACIIVERGWARCGAIGESTVRKSVLLPLSAVLDPRLQEIHRRSITSFIKRRMYRNVPIFIVQRRICRPPTLLCILSQ